LLTKAGQRLTDMLFVLHPATLEEDGLVVTLDIYLETYVGTEGIDWTVTGDESIELPLGVAALGFRLAREAVANVLRHAAASRIDVAVEAVDGKLTITVIDDGIGIESSKKSKAGHLGLSHCQALASASLGSFIVASGIDGGTTVLITLPTPVEANTTSVYS